MNRDKIADLNRTISTAVAEFKPPEKLTVSQWADKYRRLSPESSAEPGPWRTSRTPYLLEPMDAITDPAVRNVVMVAASQVGKSELELNAIGYIIDQDPGSILYVQPSLDDARKFSRLRVAPMIRDSEVLRSKVSEVKSKDSGNTLLQKSFPGGMLTMTGSNSASALASTPARYIIGDERDRWAASAGSEGDPWSLAQARQRTFYNAKAIEVSTPTIRGFSNIENSYYQGTQERWCHQCPECGEYHEIVFNSIKFEHTATKVKGKQVYLITSPPAWVCPNCGCHIAEETMRKQPAKWVAQNPQAYEQGVRSFWLNAFSSPWTPWTDIVLAFLKATGDSERLKVVFNTLLGQLWEERGEIESEDTLLDRREQYDGELPEGVLVLTCGVDTQGDRFEYEVVGHSLNGQTWGIKKGIVIGRPDSPDTWERLDNVIDRTYYFKDRKKGLIISMTCIDSGGNFTQEVYKECAKRLHKRVLAIKGQAGDGVPYTKVPKQTKIMIAGKYIGLCWLYMIGVDSGKAKIINNLKVQSLESNNYCHFPLGEDRGYDEDYFKGLLSERMVLRRVGGVDKWRWEKISGHIRNEPFDCRNYALAAFNILSPDMESAARRLNNTESERTQQHNPPLERRVIRNSNLAYDRW